MIPPLAPAVLVFACLGCAPVGDGSAVLPIGDKPVGPRGGTPPAPFPLEASCEYVFDAADIDGDGSYNSAYSAGDAITTWVNKGTTSGDATMSTSNKRPFYSSNGGAGFGGVAFTGVGSALDITSSISGANFVTNSADFELVAIYRKDLSSQRYLMGNVNTTAQPGFQLFHGNGSGRDSVNMRISSTSSIVTKRTTFTLANGGLHMVNVHANGIGAGALELSDDWTTYETATTNAPLSTGDNQRNVHIGNFQSATELSNAWDGEVYFLALCSGELTTEERASVQAWATGPTRWGATWSDYDATTIVAAVGDSITATAPSRAALPWTQSVEFLSGASPIVVGNVGEGSGRITDCSDNYTDFVDGYGYTHLFLMCGVNSLFDDVTAATIFTTWEAIVDDALADGLTVIVSTILPFGNNQNWTSGRQTQLEALNALIAAKSGVTVIDGYELMNDPADTDALLPAYDVGDGLHLGQDGDDAFAGHVLTAIQSTLAAPGGRR